MSNHFGRTRTADTLLPTSFLYISGLFIYGDVCKSSTPKTPWKQRNQQEIKEFLELPKELCRTRDPHCLEFWGCFKSFQVLILKAEVKG